MALSTASAPQLAKEVRPMRIGGDGGEIVGEGHRHVVGAVGEGRVERRLRHLLCG